MTASVKSVIAERIGTLRLGDGTTKVVRVRVGKPTKRMGEEDYACGFQVLGLGAGEVRHIVGYDSVQAIELAIKFIGYEIQKSVPCDAVWEDAPENLGFPLRSEHGRP